KDDSTIRRVLQNGCQPLRDRTGSLGVHLLAGKYCGGSGLSGRSESQYTVTIHQRLPSFNNCMLLMPRANGVLSVASWRESYVLKTCAIWPNWSTLRAISRS